MLDRQHHQAKTQSSEDEIFNELDTILKLRRSRGVNNFTEESFPREIYQIGVANFLDNNDDGQANVWDEFSRLRTNYKSPEFQKLFRDYIVYFYTLQQDAILRSNWDKFNVIFDLSDITVANINFDIYADIIMIGQTLFPCIDANILLVNMPPIVVPIFNQIKRNSNKRVHDMINIITVDELIKYINKNKLPKQLKGLSTKHLPYVPQNAKPLELFASPKFSAVQIKAVYTMYENELKPNSF